MYLWLYPELPNRGFQNLCSGRYNSKKKLAKKIGIFPSQLSRIVSGETKIASSDILIGIAKEFKVSMDYVWGLSTMNAKKQGKLEEEIEKIRSCLFLHDIKGDMDREEPSGEP